MSFRDASAASVMRVVVLVVVVSLGGGGGGFLVLPEHATKVALAIAAVRRKRIGSFILVCLNRLATKGGVSKFFFTTSCRCTVIVPAA